MQPSLIWKSDFLPWSSGELLLLFVELPTKSGKYLIQKILQFVFIS